MTDKLPLILVDGSSYLYRAFHALPPLTNSKGRPTGAVKGVINMIRRLLKDYHDSTVVVVFDAKGKTFRDDMYDQYKANRPPMPDDLRVQIDPIHKIIDAMGLPILTIEGVEADDVIGTLAVEASAQAQPVIISTGDKDIAQLVNEYVTMVNTMTDTVLNSEGVRHKFGVPPELIIDYLALLGDKSDNIPGVPGVGEKTALGLLQGIGGLDDIYSTLDQVAELDFRGAKNLAPKLAEHKELAYLSYALATIKTDVHLPLSLSQLKHRPSDDDALLELFVEQEFKAWTTELTNRSEESLEPITANPGEKEQAANKPKAKHYETVLTEEQLQSWVEKIVLKKQLAVDTETTSLDYMAARMVGISLAVERSLSQHKFSSSRQNI